MLPATKPVLPSYGTTAKLFSLQYFNIYDTFYVVLGNNTILDLPLKVPNQSVL